MLRRRLTFANVVALIALLIALGGGAYAAAKISGKKFKPGSIPAAKLKPDAVGGAQIDEPSLRKVGSAQRADTAAAAGSARTLAGIGPGGPVLAADMEWIRFDRTLPTAAPPGSATVLRHGPLRLVATCTGSGGGTRLEIRASTSAAGAGYDVGTLDIEDSPGTTGGFLGDSPVQFLGRTAINGFTRTVGTFLYNDPAATISVPFIAFVSDGASDGRCFLTATSTRATR